MKFSADEIASVIQQEIDQYDSQIDVREVGTVLEVGDGIAQEDHRQERHHSLEDLDQRWVFLSDLVDLTVLVVVDVLHVVVLEKLLQAIGVEDVSSRQLAESLDIKASQLRHDFHYFGGFSRPGRPYQVEKLVPALEKIIGIAEPVPTAIIGAGHLGQALANYQNLEIHGFPVKGIFDGSPDVSSARWPPSTQRSFQSFEATVTVSLGSTSPKRVMPFPGRSLTVTPVGWVL